MDNFVDNFSKKITNITTGKTGVSFAARAIRDQAPNNLWRVSNDQRRAMSRRRLLRIVLPAIFLFSVFFIGLAQAPENGETDAQMEKFMIEDLRNREEVSSEILFEDPDERRKEGLVPWVSVKTGNGLCYGLSGEEGFLISWNNGKEWMPRNEGLPKRKVYPFVREKARFFTALGVDPASQGRVAVCTVTDLYLSEDFGQSWRKLGPIPGVSYLTAVALSPTDKDTISVGTSYEGFFETRDLGRTWAKIAQGLGFINQGANLKEEISALSYHPAQPEWLFFSLGFGKGLYRWDRRTGACERVQITELEGKLFKQLHFYLSDQDDDRRMIEGKHLSAPGVAEEERLSTETPPLVEKTSDFNQLSANLVNTSTASDHEPQENWLLQISLAEKGHEERVCFYSLASDQIWEEDPLWERYPSPLPADSAKEERRKKASDKFGLYVNYNHKRFEDHLGFIEKNGINAVVIDFKDDNGVVAYDTALAMPRKIGAVRERIKIKSLIEKAAENEIYLIGRIVVFKDQRLYQYNNHQYAVWDRLKNKPWGDRESWVDPFSPEVWEYNIAIAEELERLGVDEIQFDYIRFPTDGDLSGLSFRHQPAGMMKVDALESFMAMARERLTVPISIDLYGFNCWYRMEGLTGQNLELLSAYVDVICPMFYPSHFPDSFLKSGDYLERAKRIYYEGSIRAKELTWGESIIRPYLQAFLIGRELRMEAPEYSEYLIKQIEGIISASAAGFTLWNNSNRYYMVRKPLTPYLGVEEEQRPDEKGDER